MAKKKTEEQPQVIETATPVEEEMFVNTGFQVSVRDVLKANQEKRAQYEADRALRASNPSGSRISRLKVMADTPYFVKFLHDYDAGLEIFVHMWRGDQPCNEICKVHYGEPCDICTEVGTKYGESYHVPMRCFLGWVYNNVGGTFSKTDERTKEVKTYNLNPIKLIQIPLGKNDANIAILLEASSARRHNYFRTDIWQIERKKGAGFSQPKTIDDADLVKLVGRDVPLEVSEAAQKISAESKKSIMTMILSSFDNVQWEKLGLEPPKVKAEHAEITERNAPAGQADSAPPAEDGL